MKIDKMDNAATMTVRTDNIRRFTLFTAMPSRSLEFAQSFPKIGNTQFQYNISDPNSIAPGSPVYYQEEMIGSLIGIYEESRQLTRLLTMDMFGCEAEAYLCNGDGIIISSNRQIQ